MKVLILRSFAGPGGAFEEGAVVEMPEGADWIVAGLARPAEPESASMEAPEKAVKPRTTRRKRSSKKKDDK